MGIIKCEQVYNSLFLVCLKLKWNIFTYFHFDLKQTRKRKIPSWNFCALNNPLQGHK